MQNNTLIKWLAVRRSNKMLKFVKIIKLRMISNDLRQLTALCESIPSLSNFEQQRVAY